MSPNVAVRLPAVVLERIEHLALEEGVSRSRVLRDLIMAGLRQKTTAAE